jgi:secreted trypsin-like serine protease
MNFKQDLNSIVEDENRKEGFNDKLRKYRKCILLFINDNLRILTFLLIAILVLIIVILSGLLESMKLNSRHVSISNFLKVEDSNLDFLDLCGNIINNKRIVNEENANQNKWPWFVSFHKIDLSPSSSNINISRHFCSGVLISKNFILSAAHCFKTLNASDIGVMIDEKVFLVDKLIVHSSYKFTTYSENDISLIKLRYNSSSDDFSLLPICLPDSKINENFIVDKNLTVASFGDVKTVLNGTQITIQDTGNKLCNSSGFYDENILYCAIDMNGTVGLCNGDSGSPLFKLIDNHWVLFGIASYVTAENKTGVFECIPSLPSYFTKVSKYLDWIKLNTN